MNRINIKLTQVILPCDTTGCLNRAIHHHHIYSKTKYSKKRYGKLLDEDFNIQLLCNDCHEWKQPLKHDEQRFREAALKKGFILPPAGKSLQYKRF